MRYNATILPDLTGEVQVKVSGTVNPIITSLNSQLLQTMPGQCERVGVQWESVCPMGE